MDAAIGSRVASAPDREHLRSALQSLMRRCMEGHPGNRYLQEHSQPQCIDRHVRMFCDYARYLPDKGDILDWGCHHAPDSCLLKTVYPDRFRLHGCDFVDSQLYSGFHEYSGLEYRQLTEVVATPYSSHSFDAIIGSGVLEHVAMDYESLKELHRILKPGGTLIITYLPNRLSAKEWARRVIWMRDYHNRLYSLAEARQLLKRSGFLPLMAVHASGGAWPAPLRFFRSTLTLVAQKVHAM